MRLSLAEGKERGAVRTRFVGVSALFCAFFLLVSCATKRIEIPTYEGVDVLSVLFARASAKAIDSSFSIEVEKDGSAMRGDAVLKLTPGTLDLQVYSLGFLVAEVVSNDTVTKSTPPLDRNRLLMLVDGIRNSFFWWSIKDPEVREDEDVYQIRNSWRRLILDRKTLMPEKQVIELEDGRQLTVFYSEPLPMEGGWFPSRMRIELANQSVKLKINSLSLGE